MDFRIADTFTDSLARLTGDEQKAVKTTAFDLQLNPANPGMGFHKLDKAKDKDFWSVRVNSDIRLIVHKTGASLMLCYVDHHDKAYAWAERRRLETHPKTGAAQFVEIREWVEEITIPKYVAIGKAAPPKPPLLANATDDELLGYGVPVEWLNEVRAANEETILDVASHLPGEAAEAVLGLATGTKPPLPLQKPHQGIDPFAHPDALRRFRTMGDLEELERSLNYPWEKWINFLHPSQRQFVEADYNGPTRVSGSAGTGKTVIALHRAVFLAKKNPEARVLLATFSEPLANALRSNLRRLISNEPRLGERIEVHALNTICQRLYELKNGPLKLASPKELQELVTALSQKVGSHKFTLNFLIGEWEEIVDAWQLNSWEEYRDVARLGRKTRLPEKQRRVLWTIFEMVRSELQNRRLPTYSQMFSELSAADRSRPPFEFAVIDEAQDISPMQLRFLAALGAEKPNCLFFAGDTGQRIFQQPFSWKSLGIDVRGRSRTLKINYRTSHQIRTQADRLLGPETTDVDGNVEERRGTVSVFNGPPPVIQKFDSADEEIESISAWLKTRSMEGLLPHEVAVFVRTDKQLDRAMAAVRKAGLAFKILDERVDTTRDHVSVSTMHLAKGLEFRAVVVMACDDEIIPLQERIETAVDDADLEETYNTERHLLYVACTRARDHLLATSGGKPSEFLDDMRGREAGVIEFLPCLRRVSQKLITMGPYSALILLSSRGGRLRESSGR
jgi:mRNA-degrading endonuclease RelE of RelBE toxin-antitoxin system